MPAAAVPTSPGASPTNVESLFARAFELIIKLAQQQFESSWAGR
jgi:hypothetical protein